MKGKNRTYPHAAVNALGNEESMISATAVNWQCVRRAPPRPHKMKIFDPEENIQPIILETADIINLHKSEEMRSKKQDILAYSSQ